MQISHYLAISIFVLCTSAKPDHAHPLFGRQSTPPVLSLSLCQDWGGSGSNCVTLDSYAVATGAFGPGVEINTNQINGISSILVSTTGVTCTFGNVLASRNPFVICTGATAAIKGGDPQLDLGNNNNYGPLNDNVNCFYCVTTS